MSKLDIGVGEEFPLDESQTRHGCRGGHHQGRHHRHGHDRDEGRHEDHQLHHAAMTLLFALKARRRSRHGRPQ